MPEQMPRNEEVAIVFRKDTSLLIPPFELPIDTRPEGETLEATALRMANEYGVIGSIEYHIPAPIDAPTTFPRGYLIRTTHGEFDDCEFLVDLADAPDKINEHYPPGTVESKLLHSAHALLSHIVKPSGRRTR